MIYGITPTAKGIMEYQSDLTDISTDPFNSGDIITNGKELFSDVLLHDSGIVILRDFLLTQYTTGSSGIDNSALDLYISDNEDAFFPALDSNAVFALDSTTTGSNILFRYSFVSGDWITLDDSYSYLQLSQAMGYIPEVLCRASGASQKSLGYWLVSRGTPDYTDMTFNVRAFFEQCEKF